VSEPARRCLALVGEGRVREALASTPDEAAHELEALSVRLAEGHLERRLRAPGVLTRELGS
jgi:hypothetical protein